MLTDDDHTKDQPRTRQTPARRVPYHHTILLLFKTTIEHRKATTRCT